MSDSDGASVAGFPALFNARVTDDENLRAALWRIATAGRDLLSSSAGASVTIIERRTAMTAASTDDLTLTLDEAQYDADDGPCLSAARSERVIRLDDIGADDRWPQFSGAAVGRGVHSSLSSPLRLAGGTTGGLNLYGRS